MNRFAPAAAAAADDAMDCPSSSISQSPPCSVSPESVIVSVGAVLDGVVMLKDAQSSNVLPVVPVGGWSTYC